MSKNIKNLSEFRNQKKLTQKEMAKKLDVSISFYQKIEQGRKNTSFNFIKKFKKVFPKADIDELFFKKVS